MKYRHNFDDKRAKSEQRLGNVLNVLWILDALAACAIFLAWMLVEFVFRACQPGGICMSHLFAGLMVYVSLGTMVILAV